MSRSQDVSPDVLSLLSALCDNAASQDDLDRLEESVGQDKNAIALVLDYLQLHSDLYFEFTSRRASFPLLHDIGVSPIIDSVGNDPSTLNGPTATPSSSLETRTRAGSPDSVQCLGAEDESGPLYSPAFHSATPHSTIDYFSSGWPVAYLVAAVIVGIGMLIGALTYVSQPTQIATHVATPSLFDEPHAKSVGRVTGMTECHCAKGVAPLFLNDTVPIGREVKLESGLMEITYDTGAKVILQGPVTYEVESAAGGFLSVGKLTARVEKRVEGRGARGGKVVSGPWPAASKPEIPGSSLATSSDTQSLIPNPSLVPRPSSLVPLFSVRTPTAAVTDLGTEFGVEVDKRGVTQVHVLQGVVEARRAGHQQDAQQLTEGKAVEIGRDGEEMRTVTFAPQSFTRKLQRPTGTPAEAAYIKAVLADKPMGYWPLNERAGARKFLDRSGNGTHGYAMREVVAGQPGPLSQDSGAVALNGNGYIDLGCHNEFAMKNDFTVEAWVWIGKVVSCSHVISALGRDGGDLGWGLIAGCDGLRLRSSSESRIILDFFAYGSEHFQFPVLKAQVVEDRWLHVAVAFDRANAAHLYLNGTHRGSVSKDKPAKVGRVWLQIGCADLVDADFWRGRLAHIAVYPRTLSEQQIRNHYSQRGNGGTEVPDKQP